MRIINCFIFICGAFGYLNAQTFSVFGSVIDKKDTTALIEVPVMLFNLDDTTKFNATITDLEGKFLFKDLALGEYAVRIKYLGYKTFEKKISLIESNARVRVKLESDAKVLDNVDINAVQTRVSQKGDTSEINANAYKVNQDATTEDLIKKMPGITVENGTVKAQGEDVKKVLIDGKEFFGDDVNAAIKNLPADVIDKIQVFDKLSDQSQFTGFNDGNTTKTINIVTKKGMSNGTFGKVFAGYGTDERYQVGGNYNFFKGNQKISILGMSNNINVQNFSSQDLLGVAQSASSGGRGGGRRGGNSDPTSNFMTAQQGGISTTHSFGINYSNQWAKKLKFSGSYFYNNSFNVNSSNINRSFYLSNEGGQVYAENSSSSANNENHRLNMRVEYNPDTINSITFSPQVSLQTNGSGSDLSGLTSYNSVGPVSSLSNLTRTKVNGYNAGGNLLLMRRFKKEGRTVSFNINGTANDKNGSSFLNSSSQYYFGTDTSSVVDQRSLTASNGINISTSLVYTEPIKKIGQLHFNYSPSFIKNGSEKFTDREDTLDDVYSVRDSVLSNQFNNQIIIHQGGFGLRIRKEKLMGNIVLDYQNTDLTGNQTYPLNMKVHKTFQALLPKIMTRYKFSKTREMRIFYRTSTDVPSVTQLQNVIDNSNPQYLSSGNPDLKQQYNHSFNFKLNDANVEKGTTFYAFLNASATQNYIANSTLIALLDTMINDDVLLKKASQLSKPVNLNDYYGVRSLVTYGFPVKKIKCNLNVNGGFNFQHSPALINRIINYSSTYSFNGGLMLSSNISEKVDFSVGYTPNYTLVENTIQTSSNNNYYVGTANAKITLQPWKGLVISSEASHYNYVGLSSAFNQNFVLWNAGLGWKFLKNKAAEFRLTVFDILKQNNSLARNITETYTEDVQTKILQQYFMLNFTYNFKKFGSSEKKDEPKKRN